MRESKTPAVASVRAGDVLPGKKVKSARDLWSHEDVKFTNGIDSSEVPSHGVLMLRVSGEQDLPDAD